MPLQKARITVLDKDATTTQGGKIPPVFDVQFNPTEYTVSKGVQIAEIAIPGLDSPLLQFVRGQNEKLTLDLLFDTTIDDSDDSILARDTVTDVRTQTDQFYQLAKVQPELHAPPRINFKWGSLNFNAIVESVQQKFTLFSEDGYPLRATLTVTFREYRTLSEQLGDPPRYSADRTKQRVVAKGETLSGIAAKVYKDPAAWRYIAEHNNIDNPRRLPPGTVLVIPPIEYWQDANA